MLIIKALGLFFVFSHIINWVKEMRYKILIIGMIILYCFILKYMFHVFLPFILALLCFFIIKPLIDYLEKIFHMKKSAIGISILLCFYLLLVSILLVFMMNGIIYCLDFLKTLPSFYENLFIPFFQESMTWIEKQFPFLIHQDYLQIVTQFLQQYLWQFVDYLSFAISHIPQYLFSFFMFIISSFFLVLEYDQIKEKIFQICPISFLQSFIYIKNQCIRSLKIYIKCQLILMNICFVILFLGFMILRIKHFFLLAIITAFFDSLPFIGVGIVLIPLFVVFLLKEAYLKAFYIFLLYLIINLLRSLLEPQIMNKQMKIPSFLLLLSMMIHLYLFGFIGIFLSPIHMNLIYSYLDYHQ